MPPDPGYAGPDLDGVIVGDGPAGMALAAACRRLGASVRVIGPGSPWSPTYGVWVDELGDLDILAGLGDRLFQHQRESVRVIGEREHRLARPYGVLDNDALADHLSHGVDRDRARAVGAQQFRWGTRVLTDRGSLDARWAVDASGAGGRLLQRPPRHHRDRQPGWQTAFGVVIPEIPRDAMIEVTEPAGVEARSITLMDLRDAPIDTTGSTRADPLAAPSFCYVVPVADGWLVEETVLTARPAVPPDQLRARLAGRLGAEGPALIESAVRTERVNIAMGGPLPRRQPVVAFGASAGYVHPATGYSITASLRGASRVAEALLEGRDPWAAVWPRAFRRSRVIHDYGAELLIGLDGAELRRFFDAFFELPMREWSTYLRLDVTPTELAGMMRTFFRQAPGPLRRRLLSGDHRIWAQFIAD